MPVSHAFSYPPPVPPARVLSCHPESARRFERAAERLDVAAQITHIHIAAALELGDSRLADRELTRQFLLGYGPSLAQLMKCQSRIQCRRIIFYPRLARGQQALRQRGKWP